MQRTVVAWISSIAGIVSTVERRRPAGWYAGLPYEIAAETAADQPAGGQRSRDYDTVFLNAFALARISTVEIAISETTGCHRSANVAPRITMPRAIRMKCVAGKA